MRCRDVGTDSPCEQVRSSPHDTENLHRNTGEADRERQPASLPRQSSADVLWYRWNLQRQSETSQQTGTRACQLQRDETPVPYSVLSTQLPEACEGQEAGNWSHHGAGASWSSDAGPSSTGGTTRTTSSKHLSNLPGNCQHCRDPGLPHEPGPLGLCDSAQTGGRGSFSSGGGLGTDGSDPPCPVVHVAERGRRSAHARRTAQAHVGDADGGHVGLTWPWTEVPAAYQAAACASGHGTDLSAEWPPVGAAREGFHIPVAGTGGSPAPARFRNAELAMPNTAPFSRLQACNGRPQSGGGAREHHRCCSPVQLTREVGSKRSSPVPWRPSSPCPGLGQYGRSSPALPWGSSSHKRTAARSSPVPQIPSPQVPRPPSPGARRVPASRPPRSSTPEQAHRHYAYAFTSVPQRDLPGELGPRGSRATLFAAETSRTRSGVPSPIPAMRKANTDAYVRNKQQAKVRASKGRGHIPALYNTWPEAHAGVLPPKARVDVLRGTCTSPHDPGCARGCLDSTGRSCNVSRAENRPLSLPPGVAFWPPPPVRDRGIPHRDRG